MLMFFLTTNKQLKEELKLNHSFKIVSIVFLAHTFTFWHAKTAKSIAKQTKSTKYYEILNALDPMQSHGKQN